MRKDYFGKRVRWYAVLLVLAPVVALPQSNANTTGTVSLAGTVSRFVELTTGDASASLTGNVGGGVGTVVSGATPARGPQGPALSVPINLGELGPSNLSEFVKANVPLKLRSNAPYTLSMSASSFGTSDLIPADVGFGVTSVMRTGIGVVPSPPAGALDTITAFSGDPTTAPGSANATTGRFEYTAAKSDLADFSTSSSILTGSRINNPVPRENTNGLRFNAVFSVKPQFYSDGSVNVTVNLTVATP